MLFDREPMKELRASIEKVGILVPLTVYWSERHKKFVILDGQRRWTCAKDLPLEKVPVNQVAEPSTVQNIVTMFQIHKLRKDWELMPTALTMGVLMKQLDEKGDRSLAQLTGLPLAVVTRCKKLLSFEKKYQDMMLDADPEKRVKADFFIELYVVVNDQEVRKMSWFAREGFIDRMLAKWQKPKSGLKAVTDFRTIKQHISNARKAGKMVQVSKRLREFSEDDSLTPEHVDVQSASAAANARKLQQSATKLEIALGDLDLESSYGELALWDSLEKLMNTIREKLLAVDRRLP
jgi:ParB/RepB/Spo0J family partition protein